MTGMAGCCACAVSGHAAMPPKNLMNSRRLMLRPISRPMVTLQTGPLEGIVPCPLWVKRRTCAVQLGMSALCQKRTSGLFDHFVSAGKQGSRHCDAQRFGGLHIDHGLELGWCLYW